MHSNPDQDQFDTQPTTAPDQPTTRSPQPDLQQPDPREPDLPQRNAWGHLEDQEETPRDYARFIRFLHLGPTRSLLGLYRAELAEKAALAGESPKKPDSTPSSLRKLADRFKWSNRAYGFTLAETAADQADYATTRRERSKQLLEQQWEHGQQMTKLASDALKHGHKFFNRTTKLVWGKVVETEKYDRKRGKMVIVQERVDREIVNIEMKTGDIIRALMSGSEMSRRSVDMTSEKAQEEFLAEQAEPPMDKEAIDQEICEMFEALGANKYVPQRAAKETEDQQEEPDDRIGQ